MQPITPLLRIPKEDLQKQGNEKKQVNIVEVMKLQLHTVLDFVLTLYSPVPGKK